MGILYAKKLLPGIVLSVKDKTSPVKFSGKQLVERDDDPCPSAQEEFVGQSL